MGDRGGAGPIPLRRPCEPDCHHTICSDLRVLASRPCALCGEPIGYGLVRPGLPAHEECASSADVWERTARDLEADRLAAAPDRRAS